MNPTSSNADQIRRPASPTPWNPPLDGGDLDTMRRGAEGEWIALERLCAALELSARDYLRG